MYFATELVILMAGLMTHVGNDTDAGPDRKEYVAIVKDDHSSHKPFILIEERFNNEGEDILYYLKPGDVITFERGGVVSGSAVASEQFVQFVPTLTEPLTNSLLAEAVKKNKDHDETVARVQYPEGELFVFFHETKARFVRGNDVVRVQCVPELTAFVTETTGDVTMKITHRNGDYEDYSLKPDSLVEIVNQEHAGDASEHFSNYRGMLRRRYLVVRRAMPTVEEDGPCHEIPQLPPNLTLGELPNVFLATRLAKANTTKVGSTPTARTGSVFDMRLSEHPACTNTDYP